MEDILNLDYINSLPQPFIAYFVGDKDFKFGWPVTDIDVGTGFIRIDVCGRLEVKVIWDVKVFVDMDGDWHEPDTFFNQEVEL